MLTPPGSLPGPVHLTDTSHTHRPSIPLAHRRRGEPSHLKVAPTHVLTVHHLSAACCVAHMDPASDPHMTKEALAELVVEHLDLKLAMCDNLASSDLLYSCISNTSMTSMHPWQYPENCRKLVPPPSLLLILSTIHPLVHTPPSPLLSPQCQYCPPLNPESAGKPVPGSTKFL